MKRSYIFVMLTFILFQFSCSRKSKTDKIINCAESWVGVPYKFGGETRRGIDCSAFMQQCFSCGDIGLYRRAVWQSGQGKYVEFDDIEKGDLVFFRKATDTEISHVGLVISGKGRDSHFIHASGRIGRVAVSRLGDSEWLSIYIMARHVE
jgi:cell wall-associated NlpC family hydrolase